MAAIDRGCAMIGKADHLNEPDVTLQIARKWRKAGVSAKFDVGLISVALGTQKLTRERDRVAPTDLLAR